CWVIRKQAFAQHIANLEIRFESFAWSHHRHRPELSELPELDVGMTQPTFERERPNALLRFAFKIPPLVYHGPIAEFWSSRCVLKLTTTGRKPGKPRPISVSYLPPEEGIVIFSGFGVESHWYRNVLAEPRVSVKVGRRTMDAVASVIEDPDRRK